MSSNFFWLCGGIIFNALAALSLKLGAKNGDTTLILKVMKIDYFMPIAIFCYFSAFLFYSQALKFMTLSFAQPIFTIGSLIITVLIAIVYLNERLEIRQWAALIFMLAGLFLMLDSEQILSKIILKAIKSITNF